jgi:ATP-dependent helicase YprA (DUF1998 family)
MTTITIDNVKHEEEDLTDDQKKLVQEVQINQNAITLLDHQLNCLKAAGTVKLAELRKILKPVEEKTDAKST